MGTDHLEFALTEGMLVLGMDLKAGIRPNLALDAKMRSALRDILKEADAYDAQGGGTQLS
jgi:hypothetical protein